MTASNKRVSVPSAVGKNRRRIEILEAVAAASGGSGIQFNSGSYGSDNVGDWLMIETDDILTADFSLTSNANPDDTSAGGVGVAITTKYGMLVTVTDDADDDAYALNVLWYGATNTFASGIFAEAKSAGTGQSLGAELDAVSSGTGQSRGVIASGQSTSGSAKGLSANGSSSSGQVRAVQSLGSSQSGDVWGGYFQGTSGSSGTPDVIGVSGLAANSTLGDSVGIDGIGTQSGTSGDAIGGRFKGANLGSGAALAIRCVDASNAPIFEVWDDGTIHGLASVGAITWDL